MVQNNKKKYEDRVMMDESMKEKEAAEARERMKGRNIT